MADDEFDIDFGDGDFNIEGEDHDLYPAGTGPSASRNDDRMNDEETHSQVQRSGLGGNSLVLTFREDTAGDSEMAIATDVHGTEVSNTPIINPTAMTPRPEHNLQPESDQQMDDDDEFHELISQLDESEICRAYLDEHAGSNGQAAVSSTIRPLQNINTNPSSSGSGLKTLTILSSTKLKVPGKSPLKRELCSEIPAFFSSQEDSHYAVPVKRSFPGPAGLLPNFTISEIERKGEAKLSVCQRVLSITSNPKLNGLPEPRRQSFSRTTINVLQQKESKISVSNAPWRSLVNILNLNLKDNDSILHAMNIDWVKWKVKKFPLFVKIPLLVLVVKEDLEAVASKAKTRNCIRLMDHSGTITAALDEPFIKEYADQIVLGASLALRNCRILLHRKSVILTVSKGNLLCLSTTKEFDDDQLTPREGESNDPEFPSYKVNEHGIHMLQRAPWAPEKIMQDYENLIELMDIRSNDQNEFENAADISRMNQLRRPLFSTIQNGSNNQWMPPRAAQPTNENINNNLNNAFFNTDNNAQANFAIDTSGFDDDDDAEFLQALEGMDFEIEEDI